MKGYPKKGLLESKLSNRKFLYSKGFECFDIQMKFKHFSSVRAFYAAKKATFRKFSLESFRELKVEISRMLPAVSMDFHWIVSMNHDNGSWKILKFASLFTAQPISTTNLFSSFLHLLASTIRQTERSERCADLALRRFLDSSPLHGQLHQRRTLVQEHILLKRVFADHADHPAHLLESPDERAALQDRRVRLQAVLHHAS